MTTLAVIPAPEPGSHGLAKPKVTVGIRVRDDKKEALVPENKRFYPELTLFMDPGAEAQLFLDNNTGG